MAQKHCFMTLKWLDLFFCRSERMLHDLDYQVIWGNGHETCKRQVGEQQERMFFVPQ
jgi:hypothetical protein